ncbi:MAG: GyrI-like domain-containing protein [Candidatus Pacearchaeota archaeon]|jgi:predicted transcriptional regulator YdeE
MTQKNITKENFQIIGIKIKTSNQKAMQDIPQLWNKFYTEDIKNQIPNKLNEDILAIYSEYEGDHTKPYSYMLGCVVDSLEIIPKGMIGITIPSAKYEIFIAKGKMPDKVIETWQQIWQPETDSKRSYKTDFEIYGKKYKNPENSEVEIYIGIK